MATKTSPDVEPVLAEISTFRSNVEAGSIVPDGAGGWKVVVACDGYSADENPTPEAVAERMLAGEPPFRAKHKFQVGADGYKLVRFHKRPPKTDSAGNVLVDASGRPVGNGAWAIFTHPSVTE